MPKYFDLDTARQLDAKLDKVSKDEFDRLRRVGSRVQRGSSPEAKEQRRLYFQRYRARLGLAQQLGLLNTNNAGAKQGQGRE